MTGSQTADDVIRRLGGCSRFQLAVTSFTALAYLLASYSTIFMAFGMHNPGWRCLDNDNGTNLLSTTTMMNSSMDNGSGRLVQIQTETNFNQTAWNGFADTCIGFESCQRVQFNPEESTIVTEWSLICGDSWKASAIISIQMAGLTIGNFMSGYLGDAHGRKLTLAVCVLIHAALGFFSVASVTWEMFAVLKFLIGVTCGVTFCLTNVYAVEFVTPKWRAIIPSLPMWVIGCSIFSLCALVFKDWRHLHIFNGVFTILLLVPAYLLPESLRWLIIKNKEKKSYQAVAQMAKLNKADVSPDDLLNQVRVGRESHKINATKLYSFVRLFHSHSRRNTFTLSCAIFLSSIIYFSSSFGVSSLPGDLYINNIVIYSTEFPGNIISFFAPNALGRKPVGIFSCACQGVSLLIFLAFDFLTSAEVREYGMLIFIIIARLCCNLTWYVVLIWTGELYPTTIRALAIGWMLFVSGMASVLSPYVTLSNDVMYVSYLVVGILCVLAGAMFGFLPETLGIDLEDEESQECPAESKYEMDHYGTGHENDKTQEIVTA